MRIREGLAPHQYRAIRKVKQADCRLLWLESSTPGEEIPLVELNQANTNLHSYKDDPGNFLHKKQMLLPQLKVQSPNIKVNIQNTRSTEVAGVTPLEL